MLFPLNALTTHQISSTWKDLRVLFGWKHASAQVLPGWWCRCSSRSFAAWESGGDSGASTSGGFLCDGMEWWWLPIKRGGRSGLLFPVPGEQEMDLHSPSTQQSTTGTAVDLSAWLIYNIFNVLVLLKRGWKPPSNSAIYCKEKMLQQAPSSKPDLASLTCSGMRFRSLHKVRLPLASTPTTWQSKPPG